MPLKAGKSKKVISKNIKELMTTKPSPAREKAIHTLMKKRGITYKTAKQILAKAAALSKSRQK